MHAHRCVRSFRVLLFAQVACARCPGDGAKHSRQASGPSPQPRWPVDPPVICFYPQRTRDLARVGEAQQMRAEGSVFRQPQLVQRSDPSITDLVIDRSEAVEPEVADWLHRASC